jgi:hypothetical protein
MAVPSAVKIKRNGIEFVSKVDRVKYLMVELERAALRDVGKLNVRRIRQAVTKLPGMRKSRRRYTGFQYWVRKRETDLQIGTKHAAWYGEQQELGTQNQPRRGIIRNTTLANIDDIRRIEGAYLSAIEDENRAIGLINEDEEGGDDEQPV